MKWNTPRPATASTGSRLRWRSGGSEFELSVDNVILAIGTTPNPLLTRTTSRLLTNPKGCLVADEETGLTSRELVIARGDAVTGAATVILAAGAGKRAAHAMHEAILARGH